MDVAATFLACAAACADPTVIVGSYADAGASAERGDAAAPERVPTSPAPALSGGTRQHYCGGHGPPLEGRLDGAATCGAGVMRRVFAHALCSCQDLTLAGAVNTVNAFDSRKGAYMAGESGAAIGVNGRFAPTGGSHTLLGNVTVFGSSTLSFAGVHYQIAGDLKSNSVIDLGVGELQVGRDVWANADITGVGSATVARDLYQAPGRSGAQHLRVGGAVHSRAFELEPPCPCGDDAPLDIAAIVAQAQTTNDNAEVGFAADRYTNVLSLLPNTLECGRFALAGVSVVGLPDTTIDGRTAWFVQGDFSVAGAGELHFGPRGELDIFITGNLDLSFGFSGSSGALGPVDRPTALRFYVGGEKVTILPGTSGFAAQVYAPHAALDLITIGDTYGSLFANTITLPGVALHYDRAILDADDACEAPVPEHCGHCDQCPAGLACISGACAACGSDSDCCDPFVCNRGKCEATSLQP